MTLEMLRERLGEFYDRELLEELYANEHMVVTRAMDSVFIVFPLTNGVVHKQTPTGIVVEKEKISRLMKNPKSVRILAQTVNNSEYKEEKQKKSKRKGKKSNKIYRFNDTLLDEWIKAKKESRNIFKSDAADGDFEKKLRKKSKFEAKMKKISAFISTTIFVISVCALVVLRLVDFENILFTSERVREAEREAIRHEAVKEMQKLDEGKKYVPEVNVKKIRNPEKYLAGYSEKYAKRAIARRDCVYVAYDESIGENVFDFEISDTMIIADSAKYSGYDGNENIKVIEYSRADLIKLLEKASEQGVTNVAYKEENDPESEDGSFSTTYCSVSELIEICIKAESGDLIY